MYLYYERGRCDCSATMTCYQSLMFDISLAHVEGEDCILNRFTYLASLNFADLLCPMFHYFSNAFVSCLCHFVSRRCMLELKFAVCHRAASPYSQVSPVVADELLLGICSNTKLTMDDKASPCLHAHRPYF